MVLCNFGVGVCLLSPRSTLYSQVNSTCTTHNSRVTSRSVCCFVVVFLGRNGSMAGKRSPSSPRTVDEAISLCTVGPTYDLSSLSLGSRQRAGLSALYESFSTTGSLLSSPLSSLLSPLSSPCFKLCCADGSCAAKAPHSLSTAHSILAQLATHLSICIVDTLTHSPLALAAVTKCLFLTRCSSHFAPHMLDACSIRWCRWVMQAAFNKMQTTGGAGAGLIGPRTEERRVTPANTGERQR